MYLGTVRDPYTETLSSRLKRELERLGRDARPRIWHEVPRCTDLDALNAWLERRCVAPSQRLRLPEYTDRTIAEVCAIDSRVLQLPLHIR